MTSTDPAGADTVVSFTADLRALRSAAGAPSYADLARRTGLPRSTLHDGLSGRRLPSLAVTLAVAQSCGGDPAAWRDRWAALHRTLDNPTASDRPESSGERHRTAGRRRRRVMAIAVALSLIAVAITAVLVFRRGTACQGVRLYRVDEAGAVLDADTHPIGDIRPGDIVQVPSLTHDRYPHRYRGTVDRTRVTGYVDEAKLTYLRDACRDIPGPG